MSSPLLCLPAELRNIIYEYALTSPDSNLHFDSESKRFDISQIGAGLLTTNRSLYMETRYLPLQLNRLVFVLRHTSMDLLMLFSRLDELEEEMGWILKRDVRFENLEH